MMLYISFIFLKSWIVLASNLFYDYEQVSNAILNRSIAVTTDHMIPSRETLR